MTLISALGEELQQMPLYSFTLSGAELLQLTSMLQLALRHPGIDERSGSRRVASEFVATVRQGFNGYPTAQYVMDRNAGATGAMTRPC